MTDDEQKEMQRLRLWVETLREDRQMYADMYDRRTEQARLEGFAAGKRTAAFDLEKANKTIAALVKIARAQGALLGHDVDLPLTPEDMRATEVKP